MIRSDPGGDHAGCADFHQGRNAILPPALPHYNPAMETLSLSAEALSILRRRWTQEWVEVNDQTRPLYRELAAAGLMYPVSGFTRGPEANFRFTEEGWALRLNDAAAPQSGSP
jgi:hypothetical protein